MSVKVHKMDVSPPARAVMMGCDIFGVKAEFIDVNLIKADHLTPEFTKKNPLHTVPLFEDGKLCIHDSHATLQYIADAYGKNDSWYPKDVTKRTQVNQKLFFDACYLFPRLRNITYPAIIEGVRTVPQKKLDDIVEVYGFLEAFLSQTKFLAGDQMTIADVSAIATVTSLVKITPLDAIKYPKINAWFQEMTRQPFCKKFNEPGVTMLGEYIKKAVDL